MGLPDFVLSVFNLEENGYQVEVKNPQRFRLYVRFMSSRGTFRMAGALLESTKEDTGIAVYGGCSDAIAARYARIVCGAALTQLGQFLSSVYVFSLALDCGTHQGKSYVDVRCPFTIAGELHKFHLLAIPLHDHHTAANIFVVLKKFFKALYPDWRGHLLGVAMDGAATMTGCINGLARLLEAEAVSPVIRVWCGLHQLDLKMQIVFKRALNESYLARLTALIGYLSRRQTLVSEMRSTSPKVASTRWLSLFQVAHWLCENGFVVRQHLEEKQAFCAPNDVWWAFLFAIREVAKEANAVFVSLQAMTTLVRRQRDRFSGLVSRLCRMSGARGPLSLNELEEVREKGEEINGLFALAHADAARYIKTPTCGCEMFSAMSIEEKTVLTTAVARMFTLAVSSIHALTVSEETSPPVTPRDLIGTPMLEFVDLMRMYRPRLRAATDHDIGEEFKRMKAPYADDSKFRDSVDAFDHRLAPFDAMWRHSDAKSMYAALASFCGGLATVFPNTATVETDFSVIGCEKTSKRTSLTDLSLEGVLHCKQWDRVRAVRGRDVLVSAETAVPAQSAETAASVQTAVSV